jgi:hypothetical protein
VFKNKNFTPQGGKMTSEVKIHYPFLALPKITRYLSFIDENGERRRYTAYHRDFLLHLLEVPEFYQGGRRAAKDLGMAHSTYKKIKKELSLPTVELGVSLIHVSEFRDLKNNTRHQIEVFWCQVEMAAYYEKLFGDDGEIYRNNWIGLWDETVKLKKCLSGPRNGPRVGRETAHNKTKDNQTKNNNKRGRGEPPNVEARASPSVVVDDDFLELCDDIEVCPKKVQAIASKEGAQDEVVRGALEDLVGWKIDNKLAGLVTILRSPDLQRARKSRGNLRERNQKLYDELKNKYQGAGNEIVKILFCVDKIELTVYDSCNPESVLVFVRHKLEDRDFYKAKIDLEKLV